LRKSSLDVNLYYR